MEYLDFDLHIASAGEDDYTVSVTKSPVGEASETLRFPYDKIALDNQLQGLELAVLKSGTIRRDIVMDVPEKKVVIEFGEAMFEAVFTGEVQMAFRRSQDSARNDSKGLRVRLRIDAAELSSLPWEFLYDGVSGDYICLSSETPLVRYMEFNRAPEALTVKPPLTLLAMIASPNDRPTLDVQHEIDRIEAATKSLQDKGLMRIEWMKGSTWRDLQRTLRTGDYHIFHFVGHGGFDAAAGEGVLAFTNESGGTQLLGATEVGSLLADERTLRLAVLNACLGAKGNTTDVFSSTSATLVRRGVPAVVAMQYEISDSAAIEFSRSLYEAIADGMPVDAAVGEARKAVRLSARNSVEWATPVLHMRSPDGMLFNVDQSNLKAKTSDETESSTVTEVRENNEQIPVNGTKGSQTIADKQDTSAGRSPAFYGGAIAVIIAAAVGLWLALNSPSPKPTPNSIIEPEINETINSAPSLTATEYSVAIARAYIIAVTNGSGATRVSDIVDYGQLGCTSKTVWIEDKCQARVLDGDDGKTLFMKSIKSANNWQQSNITDLLPEANLRRVLSDPRYGDIRRMFEHMSDPQNNWFVTFAGPGEAKQVLKQYMDAINIEVSVARAYIQAVTGGDGKKNAGGVNYDSLGCNSTSVWDEQKCQAAVLNGKDGKTVFMEMISTPSAGDDWRQSNIYSLLPQDDLKRVLTDPSFSDTKTLFLSMSDPNNDWFSSFAGPGGTKDVFRRYIDANNQ
jgi:hypothetical protein